MAVSFKLPLPPDLPPSYLGRSISFTYTLSIGTNRLDFSSTSLSDSGAAGGGGGKRSVQHKSRMIQIPIRVYNHVSYTGARPFWDLLNPVIWTRDGAEVLPIERASDGSGGSAAAGSGEEADEGAMSQPPTTPIDHSTALATRTTEKGKQARDEASHAHFIAYAKELLASCSALPTSTSLSSQLSAGGPGADGEADMSLASIKSGHSAAGGLKTATDTTPRRAMTRRRSSARSANGRAGPGGGEEDVIDTCMEAVEMLSRTSPKGEGVFSATSDAAFFLTCQPRYPPHSLV